MAELKKKRERSANFTTEEIISLVSIISNHKEVIECKKADATSWRVKDETWDIVTECFNSCNVNTRTKKTLRSKYEDLKKTVRRKCAHNKMGYVKSGSGIPDLQTLTPAEENIAYIIRSTMDGEQFNWDSDDVPGLRNENTIVKEEMIHTTNVKSQEVQMDNIAPCEKFQDYEYLDDFESQEEIGETRQTNVAKDITRKDAYLSTGPGTPEVRSIKKRKFSQEATQQHLCSCESEREEELHQMRLKILEKELEVYEARLQAAHLDVKVKQLQKQIEEARLRHLLKK